MDRYIRDNFALYDCKVHKHPTGSDLTIFKNKIVALYEIYSKKFNVTNNLCITLHPSVCIV